jgi:AhpD family alkylhydroperoxidase
LPRIPVHTIDSVPGDSTVTLQALAKRTGKVLNIHGEMAHSPVVITAYAGIADAIAEHGSFDARTRRPRLTVGAVDSCNYCQSAHTISATRAGLTEERTIAIAAATTKAGGDRTQPASRAPSAPCWRVTLFGGLEGRLPARGQGFDRDVPGVRTPGEEFAQRGWGGADGVEGPVQTAIGAGCAAP